MSASRASQAASIFYLDNLWRPLLYYIPVPACCFSYFFLHRNFLQSLFSGFVVFNSFLKAVGEALHSLFYISFSEFSLLEPVPIQPSHPWSHCVSFRLHYSPACNSSQIFYFIDIFSMHIFLDFSQFTPRRRQRGKSSTSSPAFDSLLLLECTPCHITSSLLLSPFSSFTL